ncbi:MAG: Gfo/Idh/MocA family oxidoreductase [Spirochaetia bacterium]
MMGEVDAVIIARDDFENHFQLALPFLESGLSVFVDKPLALDPSELRRFLPFLDSGKLMSCSGLRYAREFDALRTGLSEYGELRLIRAAVVNSWERYGVHLLEAVFSILKDREPRWVQAMEAEHMSVSVGFEDGLLVQIDTLGEVPFTFQVDVWGTQKTSTHHVRDNFTMFRRMLWHFIRSVETGVPAVQPVHTMRIMALLRAGRVSRSENRKVDLHELELQEHL